MYLAPLRACVLYIITLYTHVFEHSMCHACMRPCRRLELKYTIRHGVQNGW